MPRERFTSRPALDDEGEELLELLLQDFERACSIICDHERMNRREEGGLLVAGRNEDMRHESSFRRRKEYTHCERSISKDINLLGDYTTSALFPIFAAQIDEALDILGDRMDNRHVAIDHIDTIRRGIQKLASQLSHETCLPISRAVWEEAKHNRQRYYDQSHPALNAKSIRTRSGDYRDAHVFAKIHGSNTGYDMSPQDFMREVKDRGHALIAEEQGDIITGYGASHYCKMQEYFSEIQPRNREPENALGIVRRATRANLETLTVEVPERDVAMQRFLSERGFLARSILSDKESYCGGSAYLMQIMRSQLRDENRRLLSR